jgi:aspartate/methionine/tyrosine aminotransferase
VEIEEFALERYFAKHEFSARYLLSSSDCEALSMSKLLGMASPETLGLWDDLKLGYTETLGHPLLRQEIAAIYSGLGDDNLLVSAPEEGIFLLMHSLLAPGNHVVSVFPGYQSLYELAHSIGCQVSKWEPVEDLGWSFSLERLASLLRPTTKLVVVNFPHNPTGHAPTREDFEALVEILRERGIYLLSDEMYRFLEVEPGTTLPAACELYKKAFSLFGLSKSFGLPGLRIGWMVSQDRETLKRMVRIKDYTTICNSAPSEILAIMALQNRATIIAQQIKRIRENVAILEAFMEQYSQIFMWNKPTGGSICFPRMVKVNSTLAFCDKLVAESGIMLVPSKMFQYGDQHVRIGFGRDNFGEALALFSDYLDNNFRE